MAAMGGPGTFDGVGYEGRGDVLVSVFQAAARLHRTRWLFDAAHALAPRSPEGILVMMVAPPTAAPPDSATRAENHARFRRLGPSLRRFVSVPLGDSVRVSLVRAILRGMAVVQGDARTHLVTATIEEGTACLREAGGPPTPPARGRAGMAGRGWGLLPRPRPLPAPRSPGLKA